MKKSCISRRIQVNKCRGLIELRNHHFTIPNETLNSVVKPNVKPLDLWGSRSSWVKVTQRRFVTQSNKVDWEQGRTYNFTIEGFYCHVPNPICPLHLHTEA